MGRGSARVARAAAPRPDAHALHQVKVAITEPDTKAESVSKDDEKRKADKKAHQRQLRWERDVQEKVRRRVRACCPVVAAAAGGPTDARTRSQVGKRWRLAEMAGRISSRMSRASRMSRMSRVSRFSRAPGKPKRQLTGKAADLAATLDAKKAELDGSVAPS